MIYSIGRVFDGFFVSILFDKKFAAECYGDYKEFTCLRFEDNTAVGVRVISKQNDTCSVDYFFLTEDEIKSVDWKTPSKYDGYWDYQITCTHWFPVVLSLLVPEGEILYRKKNDFESAEQIYLKTFYTTNIDEAVKMRLS